MVPEPSCVLFFQRRAETPPHLTGAAENRQTHDRNRGPFVHCLPSRRRLRRRWANRPSSPLREEAQQVDPVAAGEVVPNVHVDASLAITRCYYTCG